MGKQSKMHKLAVIMRLEKPYRQLENISESTKGKIIDLSASAYLTKIGITSEISKENVTKACKQVLKLINEKSYGKYDSFKADIVKGMYQDITKQLKTMDDSSIVEFYWDIPEFVDAWSKLGFDKDNLHGIINNCKKGN